jgi:hypothetical protein
VDARDGFSFAGSPTGEEGGKGKPWKQQLRVKSVRGEEALNCNCAEKCRGVEVRQRVGVRARERVQAEVRSQHVWCAGEGVQVTLGCARGTLAQEESICVEERAFRACGEVDA